MTLPDAYVAVAEELLLGSFLQDVTVVAIECKGRERCYPCPAEWPRDETSRRSLVRAHLSAGRRTIVLAPKKGREIRYGHGPVRLGVYNPGAGTNESSWLAFDFDGSSSNDGHAKPLAHPAAAMQVLVRALRARGMTFYVELSGGAHGFHVWILLPRPTEAEVTRRAALRLVQAAMTAAPEAFSLRGGGSADPAGSIGVEIFPKCTQPVPLGNLLWLPLCAERLAATGGTAFIDPDTLKAIWPAELARTI